MILKVLWHCGAIMALLSGCANHSLTVPPAAPVETANSVSVDEELARIDEFVRSEIANQGIPGAAVAVVRDGKVIYSAAYGVRELGGTDPVSTRSVFHTASVSKPFVATAIVQLMERGQVDLDEKVTTYLPYFEMDDPRYRDITVRQMLSHTAGMPDVSDYDWGNPQYDDGAAERYVRSLRDEQLIFTPGENVTYSNVAFNVLGDLIAKVSGMSFEDYVARNILEPVGMSNSSFIYPQINGELTVTGHVETPVTISDVYPYNRIHAPSSTLNSNVQDLSRWMLVNLNRGELEGVRILESNSYDLLWTTTPPTRGVGLSWFLSAFSGEPTAYHPGGDTGFTSYLNLFPTKNIGIVALTNWEEGDARELALGVAGILVPYEEEDEEE